MKKKITNIVVLLLIVTVIALIGNHTEKTLYVSTIKQQKPQIILDAGHGGFDGGAVAQDGTVEKNINLQICLTLEQFLKTNGYEVILTRSSDSSTEDDETQKISVRKKSDLKNRLKTMSMYPDAVFVSVHLNKFTTSSANGSQVFYSGKNVSSKQLGDSIQASIVKQLQPYNTRVNKKATSSTYLLYNATIPAVLVECGFLSNKAELELLKNEDYQKQMAFSIYCGINDYFLQVSEMKET